MGWTSFTIGQHEKTHEVIDRELSSGGAWVVVDRWVRGSTYYGIIQSTRTIGKPVYMGIVVLTERKTRGNETEFSYKDMGEDMGPCYYDAPASMLNFLDKNAPEPGGYAKHWREQCRYRIQLKKERAQAKRLQTA
jgi:hypothetical protein